MIRPGAGVQLERQLAPHYYDPRATTVLEQGMAFTIEPMITLGPSDMCRWDDEWTALTVTGQLAPPNSSTRWWWDALPAADWIKQPGRTPSVQNPALRGDPRFRIGSVRHVVTGGLNRNAGSQNSGPT